MTNHKTSRKNTSNLKDKVLRLLKYTKLLWDNKNGSRKMKEITKVEMQMGNTLTYGKMFKFMSNQSN